MTLPTPSEVDFNNVAEKIKEAIGFFESGVTGVNVFRFFDHLHILQRRLPGTFLDERFNGGWNKKIEDFKNQCVSHQRNEKTPYIFNMEKFNEFLQELNRIGLLEKHKDLLKKYSLEVFDILEKSPA